MIGISSILSQLGLSYGDTYIIDLTKFERSVEKTFGILGYIPLNTFLYSPYISSALKGGFKVILSYKTQPRDHISLF
jgi:hypothetical protein